MGTYLMKKEEVKRTWYVVDAKGKVLGRLATTIASVLRGKHKPDFTPHLDCGDGVIVINAKEIKVTGRKMQEKIYKTYSGYPSGLKEYSMETMLKKNPEKILRIAVKGMLPKNKIGGQMITRLKVFMDGKHTHQAQSPKELKV